MPSARLINRRTGRLLIRLPSRAWLNVLGSRRRPRCYPAGWLGCRCGQHGGVPSAGLHNPTHGKRCESARPPVACARAGHRGCPRASLQRRDRRSHLSWRCSPRPADPPASLVGRNLPAWLIALGLLAGLARDRCGVGPQHRATGGGGRARGDGDRTDRAHVGRHRRPPSRRTGRSARRGTPRRGRRVTRRPAVVAGCAPVQPRSGHLRARDRGRRRARRWLRSAGRPRLQPDLRRVPARRGRLRFEPRLPTRSRRPWSRPPASSRRSSSCG